METYIRELLCDHPRDSAGPFGLSRRCHPERQLVHIVGKHVKNVRRRLHFLFRHSGRQTGHINSILFLAQCAWIFFYLNEAKMLAGGGVARAACKT